MAGAAWAPRSLPGEVAAGTAPRGKRSLGCSAGPGRGRTGSSEHRLSHPNGMPPSRDGTRGQTPGTGVLSTLVT